MLFINEIFSSIQGEGFYTGTPSVFVRMQGCKVHCPWCDTKHTWKLGFDNQVPISFAFEKQDAPRWASCTENELIEEITKRYPKIKHVVFTGGEPLLFDLTNVCLTLIDLGYSVQFETSGTVPLPIKLLGKVWFTVSPKVDMPGGQKIVSQAINGANEIKSVIGSNNDVETLQSLLKNVSTVDKLIYLQPLSLGEKATALCVKTALDTGYRVSLQIHKFLKVR